MTIRPRHDSLRSLIKCLWNNGLLSLTVSCLRIGRYVLLLLFDA